MPLTPAHTTERVGLGLKRPSLWATSMGLSAVIGLTACSSPPETPIATVHQEHSSGLHPRHIGRVVVLFAKTPDATSLDSHMQQEIIPKIVQRTNKSYYEATLGLWPQTTPVEVVPGILDMPDVRIKDRCNRQTKNTLATTIVARARAKAAVALPAAKNDDMTMVVFGGGRPCRDGTWASEVTGVGNNETRTAIIYDGNDPYENVASVMHEFGHSAFAAGEGGSVLCDSSAARALLRLDESGNNCRVADYGDDNTIMGGGSYLDHDLLSGWELRRLGAITPAQQQNITRRGSYNVRLHALLNNSKKGIKLLQLPLRNPTLSRLGVTNYQVELSGAYTDHDMLGCADAVRCLTRSPVPQGVSVKVYAIAPHHAAKKYVGAFQVDLRTEGLESRETGATKQDEGKVVFEDTTSGIRILLMRMVKAGRPAAGVADLKVSLR